MRFYRWPQLILLLAVTFCVSANALLLPLKPEQLNVDSFALVMESFRDVVQENYSRIEKQHPGFDLDSLEVGDKAFLPFTVLNPGQPDIDLFNSVKMMIRLQEAGLLKWRTRKKGYKFPNVEGGGSRIFSTQDCAKGVIVGDKVYLHDGNTRGITSLYLGASHLCVKITAKFPNDSLDDPEFRKKLEGSTFDRKIMLWNSQGERIDSRSDWQASDFPNWLNFADTPMRAIVMAHRLSVKVTLKPNGKIKTIVQKVKNGAPFERGIFVKVNGEPDYIEYLFAIAAQLGGYRLPLEPENYNPGPAETEYLIRTIRNGMTQPHPAMEILNSLVQVPMVPRHGYLNSREDLFDLVRHWNISNQLADSCIESLIPAAQ